MLISRSDKTREHRGKQALVGGALSAGLLAVVLSLLLGWKFLPGWVGDGLGIIAGVITTPFSMETTFFIIGLLIVVVLNIWRRLKDGDEYVEIDMSELDQVDPVRLETALQAGNDDEVKAMLGWMNDQQFSSPRVLRVRLALAEKMGDQELASSLRRALGQSGDKESAV